MGDRWAPAIGAASCSPTEVVFVSDLVGSGYKWSTTTGLSDDETLEALRRIQHKLPGAVFAIGRGSRPAG